MANVPANQTQQPMTCFAKVVAKVTRDGVQMLSDDEIKDAFNRYEKIWSELESRGLTDNIEGRVAAVLANDAIKRKVSAALRRKALAQNIKVKARGLAEMRDLKSQGLSYKKSLLAMIEGVQEGVRGARNSAYAKKLAYEQKYLGGFIAKIQKEKPHLFSIMKSRQLDDDVTKELYELRKGGTPGITKNADAQWLAREMYTVMEMSRTDANKFGANIGHLDGYAGVQTHDDLAIQRATSAKWVNDILPLLDTDKTFPEIEKPSEMIKVLEEIHTNIVTGIGRGRGKEIPHDLPGQRMRPTGIHYRLGKSRVLHFKDAEAAIKYRDLYGFGSTIGGFLSRQRTMAKVVAAMDKFGPNPDVMIENFRNKALVALRDKLKNTPADQQGQILKEISGLERGVQKSIDEMTGWASTPDTAEHWYQDAAIHNNIRTGLSMAKLGGAVITAVPSDTVSAAAASMFRGNGFWTGVFQHLDGVFKSLTDDEAKEMAYLLGEGFDGITGHISSGILADDAVAGAPTRWAETFFRLSGLTPWTDASRAAAVRVISAQLGYHHGKAFSKLPSRLQHVLKMHSISEAEWGIIGQGDALKGANGKTYVTASTVRGLDDDKIKPLVQTELDALREKIVHPKLKSPEAIAKAEAKYEAKAAEIINETRNDLAIKLQSYMSDETNYSIIEGDAFSKRVATGSYRPGTTAGEAMRYLMQFKGFPIAFTNRVLGRALIGGEGATKWERAMKNSGHLATVIAGMTVAGYMSLAMKDFVRGYWPPRDPFAGNTPQEQFKSASEVLIASMVAGGGLGIYGDFLFSRYNRFGHDPLVALTGPGIGVFSDTVKIVQSIRDMDPQSTQMLNFALDTTPYVNLFYLRPVLDILFINDLREQINPGYIERKRSIRRQEYNQESSMPQTRDELMQLFR